MQSILPNGPSYTSLVTIPIGIQRSRIWKILYLMRWSLLMFKWTSWNSLRLWLMPRSRRKSWRCIFLDSQKKTTSYLLWYYHMMVLMMMLRGRQSNFTAVLVNFIKEFSKNRKEWKKRCCHHHLWFRFLLRDWAGVFCSSSFLILTFIIFLLYIRVVTKTFKQNEETYRNNVEKAAIRHGSPQ